MLKEKSLNNATILYQMEWSSESIDKVVNIPCCAGVYAIGQILDNIEIYLYIKESENIQKSIKDHCNSNFVNIFNYNIDRESLRVKWIVQDLHEGIADIYNDVIDEFLLK